VHWLSVVGFLHLVISENELTLTVNSAVRSIPSSMCHFTLRPREDLHAGILVETHVDRHDGDCSLTCTDHCRTGVCLVHPWVRSGQVGSLGSGLDFFLAQWVGSDRVGQFG